MNIIVIKFWNLKGKNETLLENYLEDKFERSTKQIRNTSNINKEGVFSNLIFVLKIIIF